MKEILNESKFKLLVENLYDLIFLYKILPDPSFEYVSPSSINVNGYTPEEHYQNPDLFDKLVIDEDKPLFQFIKENPDMINKPVIIRWRHKDGKIIWTEHRFVTFYDDNKKLNQIGGFVRDVSDRKEFEFALRESEKKFRELFHQINDGIMLFKMDYQIMSIQLLEVNNTACDIIGYSREEFFKLNFIEELKKIIPEINILKLEDYSLFETNLFSKIKELIPIELNIHKFRLNNEDVVLFIIRDIKERKKLEKELLKKHRLESISILAARIAHDFNNILSAILGNISLGKFYCDNNNNLMDILLDSESACHKAKMLVDRLITFSKGGAPIKEIIDISEVVKEASISALKDSHIKFKFEVMKNLWLANVDKEQIYQVINNLVTNSKEAIDDNADGKIEVLLNNVTDFKNELIPLSSMNYVKITVKDNGIGIPKENIAKIFDPFFTTKQIGTGLGLAIAYSIIKKHNGFITVESDKDGSSFYIFLPAVENSAVKENNDKNFAKKDNTNDKKGRILIMDDDENVLFTTGKVVNKLGYKAVFAKNGIEAIDLYKKSLEANDPFQIVLMDLTIVDGMGGKETIEILLKLDPNVKVIVASGYFNDPVIANYKEYGFKGYLNKPYSIEDLKTVLSKI